MTSPKSTSLGLGAEAYALSLLQAIGSGLIDEDQIWLSSNLEELPAYFRTKEGARVMTSVVNCYRAYKGKI